jgi:hypothetical protein
MREEEEGEEGREVPLSVLGVRASYPDLLRAPFAWSPLTPKIITPCCPFSSPLSTLSLSFDAQGMRGVDVRFWNDSKTSPTLSNSLSRLHTQTAVTSFPVEWTGAWETSVNWYAPTYYCDRASAFYVAPVDGDYIFYAALDDVLQLNGTWLMVRRPWAQWDRVEGGCEELLLHFAHHTSCTHTLRIEEAAPLPTGLLCPCSVSPLASMA